MFRNELPIRSTSHKKESSSMDIFKRALGEDFIVRELTERDYGIDVLLESTSDDSLVNGKLVAIQLKSSTSIEYYYSDKHTPQFTFRNMEFKNTNYLFQLNIPSYLFVIDLKENIIYFKNIKKYVLNNYQEYQNSKNLKYIFNTDDIFNVFDFKEDLSKHFSEHNLVFHLRNFIILHKELDHLFRRYKRDEFMETEIEYSIRVYALSQDIKYIISNLNLNICIKDLDDELFTNHIHWYEYEYTKAIIILDNKMKKIAEKFKNIVLCNESYWINNHYSVFNFHERDYQTFQQYYHNLWYNR